MAYDVLPTAKRKNEKFFHLPVDSLGTAVYTAVGKYDPIRTIDGYFGIAGVLQHCA